MKEVKPNAANDSSKKEQVRSMFNSIASSYDQLNGVLSFGLHNKWKKKLINEVKQVRPNKILDVATGTADLPVLMLNTQATEIIGVDISKEMLAYGKEKLKDKKLEDKIQLEIGDCENLKFEANYFDVVTVAYGVRNFGDLEKGLSEILRVLKPNGLLVILETSVPENKLIRLLYYAHTFIVLPFLIIFFKTDKKAYSYLSKSASLFPCGKKFNNILKKIGFNKVIHHPLTLGVSTLYCATKPL